MTTTILASFPSPAQGVWHLGPIPLRAYAMFILIGVIAALFIGNKRWADRGGEPGVIFDIALWAIIFGLIGGRLYHVLTDWTTYFGPGGAGLCRSVQDPRGWPWHLGCGCARWRRGVDRMSTSREFRCLRSAMRSRPESCWHRPSAGSATTSTRSCTAGRRSLAVGSGDLRAPRCQRRTRLSQRGVDRSADRDRPSHLPVRVALEPLGFRAADLGGPPLTGSATAGFSRCMLPHTASAGSGSS